MPFGAREVLAKLLHGSFETKRQSGLHVVLRHPDGRQTYVARHTGDKADGTRRKIFAQSGFSLPEGINL